MDAMSIFIIVFYGGLVVLGAVGFTAWASVQRAKERTEQLKIQAKKEGAR